MSRGAISPIRVPVWQKTVVCEWVNGPFQVPVFPHLWNAVTPRWIFLTPTALQVTVPPYHKMCWYTCSLPSYSNGFVLLTSNPHPLPYSPPHVSTYSCQPVQRQLPGFLCFFCLKSSNFSVIASGYSKGNMTSPFELFCIKLVFSLLCLRTLVNMHTCIYIIYISKPKRHGLTAFNACRC